jgi:2-dehydropantoate 2-reductase
MRYIVYGAGAVGCSIGAHLFRQNHEVVLVGRKAHVNKINQDGLHFVTADDTYTLQIPAVTSVQALTPFRSDDVILLSVKSQHTLQCLAELKAAGASKNLPIVCCQISIWYEPTCARVFLHVYGMGTVLPSGFLRAGDLL